MTIDAALAGAGVEKSLSGETFGWLLPDGSTIAGDRDWRAHVMQFKTHESLAREHGVHDAYKRGWTRWSLAHGSDTLLVEAAFPKDMAARKRIAQWIGTMKPTGGVIGDSGTFERYGDAVRHLLSDDTVPSPAMHKSIRGIVLKARTLPITVSEEALPAIEAAQKAGYRLQPHRTDGHGEVHCLVAADTGDELHVHGSTGSWEHHRGGRPVGGGAHGAGLDTYLRRLGKCTVLKARRYVEPKVRGFARFPPERLGEIETALAQLPEHLRAGVTIQPMSARQQAGHGDRAYYQPRARRGKGRVLLARNPGPRATGNAIVRMQTLLHELGHHTEHRSNATGIDPPYPARRAAFTFVFGEDTRRRPGSGGAHRGKVVTPGMYRYEHAHDEGKETNVDLSHERWAEAARLKVQSPARYATLPEDVRGFIDQAWRSPRFPKKGLPLHGKSGYAEVGELLAKAASAEAAGVDEQAQVGLHDLVAEAEAHGYRPKHAGSPLSTAFGAHLYAGDPDHTLMLTAGGAWRHWAGDVVTGSGVGAVPLRHFLDLEAGAVEKSSRREWLTVKDGKVEQEHGTRAAAILWAQGTHDTAAERARKP